MNFMTFHIYIYILGISSSQLTNSMIFQRGRSTTNQILIGFNIINQLFLWENQLFLWPFSSSHFHILADSQPTLRFKSGGSLGSRTSDWKTWSWKWYRSLMNQAGVKVTRWVFYLQSDHTFFLPWNQKCKLTIPWNLDWYLDYLDWSIISHFTIPWHVEYVHLQKWELMQ